jgi:AcrR family transcriptional regulator
VTAELVRAGKGERTRGRLLEIAIRRFAADGYRRTSVSAVAREAGLTPGAAYAYFEGKDALFEAAVDADADALISEALEATPPGDVRDRLVSLLAHLTEGLERHPLARRVLGGGEPEVLGRLLDLPALRSLRATTAAEIAAGQRDGNVRADLDPAQAALGLEAIVLALLMGQLMAGLGRAPLGEARRAAVLAVLDSALRPPS